MDCGRGPSPGDPTAHVDGPRNSPRSLPKILSESQIERLIAAANTRPGPLGARLVAMIDLAYGSGLRASELVRLLLAEVLRTKETMIVKGKGSKDPGREARRFAGAWSRLAPEVRREAEYQAIKPLMDHANVLVDFLARSPALSARTAANLMRHALGGDEPDRRALPDHLILPHDGAERRRTPLR